MRRVLATLLLSIPLAFSSAAQADSSSWSLKFTGPGLLTSNQWVYARELMLPDGTVCVFAVSQEGHASPALSCDFKNRRSSTYQPQSGDSQ